MTLHEFKHPHRDLPTTVRSDLPITTVRVEEAPGHDYVHVWNRGGKAGELVVKKGDGIHIAHLLLPSLQHTRGKGRKDASNKP